MKRLFKNRIFLISLVGIIIILAAVFTFSNKPKKYYTVKKDNFQQVIEEKGEITGKKSINITLPDVLMRRDLRIYQIEIKDMIQEGKTVKKGDWIATLDIGQINQYIQDNNQKLEKSEAEFKDAKIDSAIELTNLREELKEAKYDLKYKKLEVDQSVYESPAYQRKINIEYDKLVRLIKNKERNYQLRKIKLAAYLKRKENRFSDLQSRDKLLKKALYESRVKSPSNGILMYAKLWGNEKVQTGSMVNLWNPIIAELPDMSVAVSVTYIKEIDITKVAIGDKAEITIDAIPDKIFYGKISKIANMGQDLPGYDTKVFRITIELDTNNSNIKPAMTTNNRIIVNNLEDVIIVPRKTVFKSNDSTYVYISRNGKNSIQLITPGPENDENLVVVSGLKENDKILLNKPE